MHNKKLKQKICVIFLAISCCGTVLAEVPQNPAPQTATTTTTTPSGAVSSTSVTSVTPTPLKTTITTTTAATPAPTVKPPTVLPIVFPSTATTGSATTVTTTTPAAADLSQYRMADPTPSTATTVTTHTVTKSNVPSMIIVPDDESLGGLQSYKESQETMLNSAPPANRVTTADEQEAFNLMMKQITPLSPRQIIRLRQIIDDSQRAASIPANVPPKPVSTTLIMNLAPGATPPAIRLARGYVSSLVFVDSTGAPWPIASFIIGDPKTSNIQWDGKSNILMIQAATPYGVSNLVVSLIGLMTPLTLELVSGQPVVDYRTDIHVSGIGPNTKVVPSGTPLPNSANQLLLNVLDGIAPAGSRTLTIRGGDAQGWFLANKMYIRTRLTLLSPGWIGRMVSPDGMMAYEVPRSSSILVSQYGQPIELKVEGF